MMPARLGVQGVAEDSDIPTDEAGRYGCVRISLIAPMLDIELSRGWGLENSYQSISPLGFKRRPVFY